MLARQQRGRRDYRDLMPGHRRDEGRTQGNLGLAETDVAANQPVHRLARRQIGQHVVDRRILIVGFLPRKAFDELIIAGLIGLQHWGMAQRAQRRGLEQFVRNRADAFLEPALALLPAFAAEPVKRGKFVIAAIAAEHVDIFDRHVELIAASVFQHHAVMRASADLDRLQAAVAPDPVFEMHHQITGRQRSQFSQKRIGTFAPLLAPHQPVTQDVLLGDQLHLGVGKAVFERQDDRRDSALRGEAQRFLPSPGRGRGGAHRLAQDGADPRAAAFRIGGNQRLLALRGLPLEVACSGFINVVAAGPLGRKITAAGKAKVDHPGAAGLRKDVGPVDRMTGHLRIEFGPGQIKRRGLQRAIAAHGLARRFDAAGVVIRYIAQPLIGRTKRRAVDQHQVFGAKVIEQREQLVFEQRQPVFHAG